MGNTNFSLWGMGNLKTNIPQYSPQWGILGINPTINFHKMSFKSCHQHVNHLAHDIRTVAISLWTPGSIFPSSQSFVIVNAEAPASVENDGS